MSCCSSNSSCCNTSTSCCGGKKCDKKECGCSKFMHNLLLLIGVGAPAFLAGQWILTEPTCSLYSNETMHFFCEIGTTMPFLFVNVMYFLNACVLFWIVSLFTGSCWLIDAYWTIIPVMIATFYKFHPKSSYQAPEPYYYSCCCITNYAMNILAHLTDITQYRSNISYLLLLVWSARLTYSYLRREKFDLGGRQDWRFTEMQKSCGCGLWMIVSFFYAFVSQWPLMVGITAPFYVIHFTGDGVGGGRFEWADVFILSIAAYGIYIAYKADNELFNFMDGVEGAKLLKIKPALLLNSGYWEYSRHPNYFGEMLWWGALSLGYSGTFITTLNVFPETNHWIIYGWLFNTLVMYMSIDMIESRMVNSKEKIASGASMLYKQYQKYTSMLIPLYSNKNVYLSIEKEKST